MPDILIRDVPPDTARVLDANARHAGKSRQEYLAALLADAASTDPDMVVGFWEAVRGEMLCSKCADCGATFGLNARVFVGMTRGYRLMGPFCQHCATTD